MDNIGINHPIRVRYEQILSSDSTELLSEFEDLIRNGSGSDYVELVWIRRELMKRMRNDANVPDSKSRNPQ